MLNEVRVCVFSNLGKRGAVERRRDVAWDGGIELELVVDSVAFQRGEVRMPMRCWNASYHGWDETKVELARMIDTMLIQ